MSLQPLDPSSSPRPLARSAAEAPAARPAGSPPTPTDELALRGAQAPAAAPALRISGPGRTERALNPADKQLLDEIQAAHLNYFTAHSDPTTGLTRDRSARGSAASIAAAGFSLTAHGVAVHRGLMPREEAAAYTLKLLKTLADAPMGAEPDAAGRNGFFYHFLGAGTARRAGKNEVSTVDTALLLGGVLFSRNYFDAGTPQEQEIRKLATQIYDKVDWNWARAGGDSLRMGWTPEKQPWYLELWNKVEAFFTGRKAPEPGFIPFRWEGYSEGMLMVLLGMGSRTHPLPDNAWEVYQRGQKVKTIDGQDHVGFGPMFGHQYSHTWIDFRGIQDAASRERGFDWHENSRRATLAQQAYAIENPKGFAGYSALDWGLTASDGPGKKHAPVDGKGFKGYLAREAGSKDDGTIAPTAAAASLPFAPEIVLPTLRHWRQNRPELWGPDGFADAFNPTAGWVGHDRIGIDQGPIALMAENYRSEFVWDVMKRDPDLRRGLQRAGFTGGWLNQPAP